MKPSTTQLLLSAAALLPSINAQAPQVVGTGIDPECYDVVTVIEYPAYFSTVYESAGTIFNFMGGTNSLVINNPPQTVITSTVLTTTVTSTTTTTVTATPGVSVTLGAGLPAGTVTSIPSTDPIVIAYIVDAVGGRRPKAFAGPDGTTVDPDDADAFYLQDGELRTMSGAKIGRNESDTYASMVATTDDNEITRDFFFVDGEIRWNSPDRGEATFYECGGSLFAGFPDAPFDNCTEATVGGILQEVLDDESNGGTTSTTRGSTSSGNSSAGTPSGSSTSGSSTSASITNSGSSISSFNSASSSGSSSTGSSISGTATGTSTPSGSSTLGSSTLMTSSTTMTGTTSGGSGTITSSGPSATTSVAGSTANCPEDNDEVVDGYQIFCARGLVADDLGIGAEAATFGQCIDRCTNTPLCVSISFNRNSKFCYLHSSLHLDFSNVDGDFDSAELVGVPNGSTTTISEVATSSTASGTMNGGPTTTTTEEGATTTTPSGGTVTDCPVSEPGEEDFGQIVYCGYAVDPTDDNNKLNGAGEQKASFDDCQLSCQFDYEECTGLSYLADSTTCYLFSGAHKAPVVREGWIAAWNVGSEGPSGPDTGATTTTTDDAAGTSTTTAADGAAGTTTTTADGVAGTTTTTGATTTTSAAGGSGGGAATQPNGNPANTAGNCEGKCPTADSVVRDGYIIYADTGLDGLNAEPAGGEIVETFEACIALCSTQADCVSVSWKKEGGACFRHKTCHTVMTDPGLFDSAERIPESCDGGSGTTTTTTAPSSIESTDPEVTNSEFTIAVNVPDPTRRLVRRLSKRAIKYISFDVEGRSILVDSEAEAARFTIVDGGLKSGTQFVALDTEAEEPRFTLQATEPATKVAVDVSADGTFSIPGVEAFCQDGASSELVAVGTGESCPVGFATVEANAVAAMEETTTTTTTSGAAAATTTTSAAIVVPPTTTSSAADAATTTTAGAGADPTTTSSAEEAATTSSSAADEATTTSSTAEEATTTTSSTGEEVTTTSSSTTEDVTTTSSSTAEEATTTTSSTADEATTTSSSTVEEVTTTSSAAEEVTTTSSSTTSEEATTTSSSATTTTTTAAAEASLCPETAYGAVVGGYNIYCGYAVDPADNVASNSLGSRADITFEECLTVCDSLVVDGVPCTGIAHGTDGPAMICYLHGGPNKAPELRTGFKGAAKVGI